MATPKDKSTTPPIPNSGRMVREQPEAQHFRVLRLIASLERPTLRTISKELGLSEPTVRLSLRWLQGKSCIEPDDSMKPHILWRVTEKGQKELLTAQQVGASVQVPSRKTPTSSSQASRSGPPGDKL